MPDERFADHLEHPRGRDREVLGGEHGVAGGAVCGDLVTVRLTVDLGRVTRVGFEAHGCGATLAAGSAVVELVEDDPDVLAVARIGTAEVAAALGGLSTGKLHAADLAADALAQALGKAVRAAPTAAPGRAGSLVAMSGGVDSAVAALLAPDAACAVTVELWRDPENDGERSCCSASAVRHARALAHRMGLPHLTVDLREEFRAGVVDPWLAGHAAGETPNPCVRCNGQVRLQAMLAVGEQLGLGLLATGHYARTTEEGLVRIAEDEAKDQSYVLARLDPAVTRRLRFPLGGLRKPEVRDRAEAAGLPVARTPDSQDLCFLAGTGRARFLERHGRLRERPGDLVAPDGTVLGRHRGAHGFTVGQRRGIGVGGAGEPLYVLGTDVAANTVTVGPRAALATQRIALRDVVLHRAAEAVTHVQLRAHARRIACGLEGDAVVLEEPVGAIAPGQLAALLAGDVIVGFATITR